MSVKRFKAENKNVKGFNLAETIIAIGALGILAAVVLPAFIVNIQGKIQKEQVRTAKYKLTLATDKMKSLGLLGEQYPTTEAFITELSRHLKLAKICNNNNLRDCWPVDEINLTDGTANEVKNLKTGRSLKALALGTGNTKTMGIVTADGVPMILVYSPKCTPLETERTYSWSTVDGKPETNATTNCISAIMDINGKRRPNRIGKDVRTWNSLYGSQNISPNSGYSPLSYQECMKIKSKLGIKDCYVQNGVQKNNDYWSGAVKKCHTLGLHLPSPQVLALAAGARYGRSDITAYTVISSVQHARRNWNDFSGRSCEEIWKRAGWDDADKIICIDNGTTLDMGQDDDSAAIALNNNFWTDTEDSSYTALTRNITNKNSNWNSSSRNNTYSHNALCIGD